MAIDLFEPRSMQRAIEVRKRPRNWYTDTYFGENPMGVHGTPTIDQDVRVQGQRMAPLQLPTEASRAVNRDSFSTGSIRIPYMKPMLPTTAGELLAQREPGANLYAAPDLVGAARARLGRDIADLDDMNARRVEYMAARGMQTGKTPLVNVGDDGKPTINAEVDWQMPVAHLVTLTGTALWTDKTNSDPIGKLRDFANLVIASAGLSPAVATVGTSVASAIIAHPQIQAMLDNRRVEAGMLELREQGVEGITYLGRIKGIDIYEDARTFTNDAGTAELYTPVDRLVLGAPRAENYVERAPIQDLKCPTPRVARWVKTWEKDDPSVRYVAVHQSALPALWQPDSFVSAKVI